MMYPNNLTLDETRAVVREHNALHEMKLFIEADRGDHIIFNYLISTPMTFPAFTGDPVLDRKYAILRECRGITFDTVTGRCIARKFQKFFNLNQIPETQANVIDFTRPHVIMDKLDGSMITPFKASGWNTHRWGTKMGITDVAIPVEAHVEANPNYREFAILCETAGFTPMFEWTSRQQRIVIDYPEDRLVLLHLRNIATGEYATRTQVNTLASSYGIPVVQTIELTIDDIDAFIEMTRGLKNLEGYVIQFTDGGAYGTVEMLKIKADEYCLLHNTKETLNLEKNALALVLDESLDDVLPQMDEGDRSAVTRYLDDVMLSAKAVASTVELLAETIHGELDRAGVVEPRERKKQYAAAVAGLDYSVYPVFYKNMLFRAFDRENANMLDEVINIIKKNTNTATQVESIRGLIGGIYWRDYRGVFDAEA
jgi:RNA ligase